MRFLVLGATGMAGHVASLYLSERGHEVWGFSRRPASFLKRSLTGDALDVSSLEDALAQSRPEIVLNCIGLLNASCDERPDLAIYLNAYLPHLLERMTAESRTRVFHLSTDCVFAGNTGPYDEFSTPDGRTLYDKSKALGELRNEKDLTLRQSIVGPDIDPHGIGLLNWFMAQEERVRGWTGAIWTGLTTLELAKAIEACALDGSSGLVNMVPDGHGIPKSDLLRLLSTYFRDSSVTVEDDPSVLLDKTLVRTVLPAGYRPIPYADQIQELASWVNAHGDIYPERYQRSHAYE
ncbi:NAD-dependent epimerase/dehydratase family protein [Adlercreutzia faecimuris]|uniref:dTDP-4-dehydrorhamnose reductase n=1 Tax=Adlercreutzia faecimuris TaxID=2897341 RepID=A0ABS9WIU3_9ACTN|nr:NAD-dependent epimerase/dehydratase family protein [Adlercreutzia sp. JBNU-10]MCI2242724.1 sugar nucleotide-binding protein [Adlercreutzia sp. JBNU-10]